MLCFCDLYVNEILKKRLCISFFKKKNFKFLVFYFYEENSSIMNFVINLICMWEVG